MIRDTLIQGIKNAIVYVLSIVIFFLFIGRNAKRIEIQFLQALKIVKTEIFR